MTAEQRGAGRSECGKQGGLEPGHEKSSCSEAFWLVTGERVSLKIVQWGSLDTE